MFSNTRFLAQAGKGIKFTQNGDDGAFVTGFADDRCRHATDILRDPEAFGLKRGHMLFYRLKFFVERFRRIKDPVCEFDEGLFFGVNKVPDRILRFECSCRPLEVEDLFVYDYPKIVSRALNSINWQMSAGKLGSNLMKTPRVALVGLKLESNRFSRPAEMDDFLSLNLLEGDALMEEARKPAPTLARNLRPL